MLLSILHTYGLDTHTHVWNNIISFSQNIWKCHMERKLLRLYLYVPMRLLFGLFVYFHLLYWTRRVEINTLWLGTLSNVLRALFDYAIAAESNWKCDGWSGCVWINNSMIFKFFSVWYSVFPVHSFQVDRSTCIFFCLLLLRWCSSIVQRDGILSGPAAAGEKHAPLPPPFGTMCLFTVLLLLLVSFFPSF
jgi:hypothetical protein